MKKCLTFLGSFILILVGFDCVADTEVFVNNQTPYILNVKIKQLKWSRPNIWRVVGGGLKEGSDEVWSAVKNVINPYTREKVLRYNRDAGIKRNNTYEFITKLTSPSFTEKIDLYQWLEGRHAVPFGKGSEIWWGYGYWGRHPNSSEFKYYHRMLEGYWTTDRQMFMAKGGAEAKGSKGGLTDDDNFYWHNPGTIRVSVPVAPRLMEEKMEDAFLTIRPKIIYGGAFADIEYDIRLMPSIPLKIVEEGVPPVGFSRSQLRQQPLVVNPKSIGYTSSPSFDSNPCVKNVPAHFKRLGEKSYNFKINSKDPQGKKLVSDSYDSSEAGAAFEAIEQKLGETVGQTLVTFFTFGQVTGKMQPRKATTHFQSIKKLPFHLGKKLKKTLVITGGQTRSKIGDLFICQVVEGKWRVVKRVSVGSKDFWHPGGIGMVGQYIAIPLEGDKGSKIQIYNMANPLNPQLLPKATITRKNEGAMAVAMTKLSNGHFLLISVLGSLDFYYSKTTKIEDGFDFVCNRPHAGVRGQNLSLINDTDGSVYIVGTQNTDEKAPVINGDNLAMLYKITRFDPVKKQARIMQIDGKTFNCANDYCNFNAGATIDVFDKSHLRMYAIYHWLVDDNYIQAKLFAY